MSFFEQIKKEREPTKEKQVGYQWVTMLIKYDINGNAELVTSRSFPAKDSSIKFASKKSKKDKKPQRLEPDIKNVEEEDLF